MCGGNDNIFRDNLIEDVGYECADTGAFYTCGQIGTGRINLNNSLINNTFRHIRNRGILHWRGVATLGVGSPFVQAVSQTVEYLDLSISKLWIYISKPIYCPDLSGRWHEWLVGK